LNDVGPFIPKDALDRIGGYLGLDLSFDTLSDLEAHLRQIHAPFGPLTDDQWAHLAEHSSRTRPDGKFLLSYDPKISAPFKNAEPEAVDLWSLWDEIACPTLVIRGAESDLLPKATAVEMTERGPKAERLEIPGVGHAPALMDRYQIDKVKAWLVV
jgi:pimeloyl-ACP methyl ester carboxylesterase